MDAFSAGKRHVVMTSLKQLIQFHTLLNLYLSELEIIRQ